MHSRALTFAFAAICIFVCPLVGAQSVKVDHTNADASAIPQSALDAARSLTMSFSHASVGGFLWDGLGMLESDNGTRYSFPNWTDNNRGNPGWQAKVDDFETWVASNAGSYEVFLNKFCWIDQDADFAYYRDSMVALPQAHGDKTLVWFTMPLSDDSSLALRATFNANVRTYTAQHNLPLFDLADIESHAPNGTAATSQGYETIYGPYTTDNGHPNDAAGVSQRRLASAMWYLMARLAGWNDAAAPVCGNGTCETGETTASCPTDCPASGPVCDNGTCETGETTASCPTDCPASGPVCGNGTCETGETTASCPTDCPAQSTGASQSSGGCSSAPSSSGGSALILLLAIMLTVRRNAVRTRR